MLGLKIIKSLKIKNTILLIIFALPLSGCDEPQTEAIDTKEQASENSELRPNTEALNTQIAQIQAQAINLHESAKTLSLQRQIPLNGGLAKPHLPAEILVLNESLKSRAELSSFRFRESADGLVLSTSTDLLFAGSAEEITSRSTESLEQLAEILKQFPKTHINIAAHSDNSKEASASLQLTQAQADQIKQQLVSAGVAANRISAKGFGDTEPVTSNNNALGRTNNRRLSITISLPEQS